MRFKYIGTKQQLEEIGFKPYERCSEVYVYQKYYNPTANKHCYKMDVNFINDCRTLTLTRIAVTSDKEEIGNEVLNILYELITRNLIIKMT